MDSSMWDVEPHGSKTNRRVVHGLARASSANRGGQAEHLVLPVDCLGTPRTVTVHSDGRISTEHTAAEVRIMLAIGILGQEPCACIRLRQALARGDEDAVRSLTHLATPEVKASARQIVVANILKRCRRRSGHDAEPWQRRDPLRGGFLDRILKVILEAINPHDDPRVHIYFNPLLEKPRSFIVGRSLKTELCIGRGCSDQPFFSVRLGTDFYRRYRSGRWRVTDPRNGRDYLILSELQAPTIHDGCSYRECITLTSLPEHYPARDHIARVLADECGTIRAFLYPCHWMVCDGARLYPGEWTSYPDAEAFEWVGPASEGGEAYGTISGRGLGRGASSPLGYPAVT